MHAHICSMFQHSYAIPKKYCLYSTHNITIVIKKSFIADKYLLLIYLPFFLKHTNVHSAYTWYQAKTTLI